MAVPLHQPTAPHPADMISDSAFKSNPVVSYRRVSSIDAASSLDGLALLAVRGFVAHKEQIPSRPVSIHCSLNMACKLSSLLGHDGIFGPVSLLHVRPHHYQS